MSDLFRTGRRWTDGPRRRAGVAEVRNRRLAALEVAAGADAALDDSKHNPHTTASFDASRFNRVVVELHVSFAVADERAHAQVRRQRTREVDTGVKTCGRL